MANTDPRRLDMVNAALAHLGQDPVSALDDASLDYSVAAQKVLRQLDQAQAAVLRHHGWLCALTYATLQPSADPALTSWKYAGAFVVPGDCLRLWQVDGVTWPDWEPRFELGTVDSDVGARQVLRSAGVAPLPVAYVRRASYAALDAHVFDAVAIEAAARACYNVTGDQNRADKLKPMAMELLQLAVSVDGTQQGGQRVIDSVVWRLRNSEGGGWGCGSGGGWPWD